MATVQQQQQPGNGVATLQQPQIKGQSLWSESWKRLRRNKAAVLGLIIIIANILMAIFADQIAPYSYDEQDLLANNAAPQWVIDIFPVMKGKDDGGYVTVSGDYLLGADALGRDLFSRIVHGARISLLVALIGPAVSMVIGMSVGMIAGYFGGMVDNVIMRFVDIMYAFPTLLLIILMMSFFRASINTDIRIDDYQQVAITGLSSSRSFNVAVLLDGEVVQEFSRSTNGDGEITIELGKQYMTSDLDRFEVVVTNNSDEVMGNAVANVTEIVTPSFFQKLSYHLSDIDRSMGGMFFIFIGIGLTSWMTMSRLVRGEVLSVRERDYIEAAHAVGVKNFSIVRKHVLPNIIGPLIVAETLTIPRYISYEAFLSFIGLGVNAPTPSWGIMISDGAQAIRSYPNQALFPALALFMIMFAFNFLGDGLRDALDPRLRGVD